MPDDKHWKGYASHAKGKRFEDWISMSLDYYRDAGLADIEKTPEPMQVVRAYGKGKFIAYFERKAQADYKGTLLGGRAVLFEAKYTDTSRLEQSRVREDQAEYLDRNQQLGALCFILAAFDCDHAYKIPWSVWADMKQQFGRKYVTPEDLTWYRVPELPDGTLLLLRSDLGGVRLGTL